MISHWYQLYSEGQNSQLSSDYVIHEWDTTSIAPENGYSYLQLAADLRNVDSVLVQYKYPNLDSVRKEATLSFGAVNGRVQRIILQVPEADMQDALNIAIQIINGILDNVTLRTGVPTQIRHIEIKPESSDSSFIRRYLTIPYTPAELEKGDLLSAVVMPRPLAPAVRLYREAVTASRPHYRLLCLYRVREAVLQVQQANNDTLIARSEIPQRPVHKVPDTDLTRQYFPDLIGKRVGAFLEHVREKYRIPIAHFTLDEFDKMILDPGDVRIDHRIDYTNAVLMAITKQMILDERDLMQRYSL